MSSTAWAPDRRRHKTRSQSPPVSFPAWHGADNARCRRGRSCQSPWAWSNGSGRLAGGPGHHGATLDTGRRSPSPSLRESEGEHGLVVLRGRHSGRGLRVVSSSRQSIRSAQRGQRKTSRSSCASKPPGSRATPRTGPSCSRSAGTSTPSSPISIRSMTSPCLMIV